MKNLMMILLCFMLIICMDSVFGMDDESEKSESSNEEEFIDLTQYTKQELNLDNLNSNFEIDAYDQKHLINDYAFENYKPEAEYCIQNVSNTSGKNVNELKRKKKPGKILACEFCQRQHARYKTGKVSGKSLCNPCYNYEYRHGHLVPLDERQIHGKHKDQILVCEFCQRESKQYIKGKFSGKSLCKTCYTYESRHGHLVPLDARQIYGKHKDQVLACELCQRQSTNYKKGKFSGNSLCSSCYQYEYRHGHVVPVDEVQINVKHKNKRKDLFNQLLGVKNSQNEDKNDSTKHSPEQQKKT